MRDNMKDSALNDSIKIQRSFSQYICVKEKVDDVLLVEGQTDYTFYSRFTDDYKIYCDDIDDYDEDEGKKKHKPTVKSLVLEMYPKGKNIYGIIDPDYKNASDIDDSIHDRIHVIDANSLETLILKYSDKTHNVAKAISNFDELFRKLFRKGKGKENDSKITDDVLKWAFFIGRIRKLSDLRNYKLYFKKVKKESNFYRNYIETSPKNNDKKEFNQEEYLKDLYNKSPFTPNLADDFFSFSNKITKNIEKYNEESVWDICQGHDIFDFIECLNSNSSCSESSKGRMHSRSAVLPWKYNLLKVFDINNFQDSPLQKWFDKINRKTTGYWKNR